ncbi:MAG: SDR family NAD(P)-dependent oxidoreductase [Clostridia bacterium]|nr:SDR family NAD(P)-dependent oxidoreductase [Clostridia bacterium]
MKNLIEMSHRFGANPAYVLAGGGNTSVKDADCLYIKGSGTSLATITEDGFVKMDRKRLDAIWSNTYSEDAKIRESQVLGDMMGAMLDVGKRPSVETFLHNLFPQKYVVHLHPAIVNGLTCSAEGAAAMRALFGDAAIWVPECEPGFVLAKTVREALVAYEKETGKVPSLVFLQNHGVFAAADTAEGIDKIYDDIFAAIGGKQKAEPDFSEVETDRAFAAEIAPMLRMALWGDAAGSVVTFFTNKAVAGFIQDEKAFAAIAKPFTPDHIVYCKASYLFTEKAETVEEQYTLLSEKIEAFKKENGYLPRIIVIAGLGVFAHGISKKTADTAKALFMDAVKIASYASAFGGSRSMGDHFIDFIVNWEAESYRGSVAAGAGHGRVHEKIMVVTGSAQGFGQGIVEETITEGANVIIADLNEALAIENAAKLCDKYGAGKALAVKVDVGTEDSVQAMYIDTVLSYGGLDVLVNNAGIVRAGTLEEMTVPMMDLVTKVNYTAYFLCVKYAVKYMKIQNRFAPEYFMDIIQINSKSGLAGSNKNFAYAGSKFGGIGLTQSFALELTPFNIKVNSVCPGNFLEGPLWMDPEKGLFVQYLKAGKVPGAKTVDDVRRFYEAKVPMNRGCRTPDVARAIYYCIEQEYETGQAIPVTGGQEMLK